MITAEQMGFREGQVVRMKGGCAGKMLAGRLAILVKQPDSAKGRRRKLHAVAKWEAIGNSRPSLSEIYTNGEVCYNPERWEKLPLYEIDRRFMPIESKAQGLNVSLPDWREFLYPSVPATPPAEDFFRELEDHLDDLFPKGKCKERGNALLLFAHANILFRKYAKRRKD